MKQPIGKTLLMGVLACCAFSASADAMHHGGKTIHMFSADRLELRADDGDALLHWEAQAWRGGDPDRLWLRTRGEYDDGRVQDGELQLSYRRAVSAYWDVSAGWRGELRPAPHRHWLGLGLHGLAPWFVDIDADLYLGESGRSALRVEASHEVLFTQRLALEPSVEVEAYGRDDAARALGAGLSSLSMGLRLRYDINRKLAPYAGVLWKKHYGDTAELMRAGGAETENGYLLAGVRAWF